MARRYRPKDVAWGALVAAVLVALAYQAALGRRGFDQPHEGFRGFLEAPGHALGWGAAAFCVFAMPLVLEAWWTGGRAFRAPRVLGLVVLGLGVGGLAAFFAEPTPAAGGGLVGAAFERMLRGLFGAAGALAMVGLVLAAGVLLTLSHLLAIPRAASPGPVARGIVEAASAPHEAGADAAAAAPRYPQRRFGPDGVEVPMRFDGSDVGEIRFRDEPAPEPSPRPPRPPPSEPPGPGVRFTDEPEAAANADAPGRLSGVKFLQRSAYVHPDVSLVSAPPTTARRQPLPPAETLSAAPPAPSESPAPAAAPARSVPPAPAPPPAPRKGSRPKHPGAPKETVSAPPQAPPKTPPLVEEPRKGKRDEPRAALRGGRGLTPSETQGLPLFAEAVPTPARAPSGGADPLFEAAADAAVERGSASLVLLARRLGVGYSRAATLLDALVAAGIVGETTASGSRPTLIGAEEWARRRKPTGT